MKTAVLADLHLPDDPDVLQWKVLDEALRCCRQEKADLIISAGDMIQTNAVKAAERFGKILRNQPIPFVAALGNTEKETPEFCRLAAFQDSFCGDDADVFAAGKPLPAGKNKFRIVVGHWPLDPTEIPESADLFICGHLHRDVSDGKLQIVRGLDPDKVIGGVPAISFFEIANGCLRRYEIEVPGFAIADWSGGERTAFLRQIGISIKGDTENAFRRAAELDILSVELNYPLHRGAERAFVGYLDRGGKVSIHLPDVNFQNGAAVTECAAEMAALGASQFTMHVPKASLRELSDPVQFEKMIDIYCRIIEKAPNAVFGIENMHMCKGESEFERRYGYTPGEQMDFIEHLRSKSGRDDIGAVLDIGHARNNGIFYKKYSLSSWFEALKGNLTAMHLHQVVSDADGYHNHQVLTGLFTPLISLASLLYQWKKNRLDNAKLFIECGLKWEESYNMFLRELQK